MKFSSLALLLLAVPAEPTIVCDSSNGANIEDNPEECTETVPDRRRVTALSKLGRRLSSFTVVDDFDRDDGELGGNWTGSSNIVIEGNKVRTNKSQRNDGTRFIGQEYDAEAMSVRVEVSDFPNDILEYVGIRMGLGGTQDPLWLKIQRQNRKLYIGCYKGTNSGAFPGSVGFTEWEGPELGVEFMLETTISSDGNVTISTYDATNGPYTQSCGTHTNPDGLGLGAGLAFYGNDGGDARADNFAMIVATPSPTPGPTPGPTPFPTAAPTPGPTPFPTEAPTPAPVVVHVKPDGKSGCLKIDGKGKISTTIHGSAQVNVFDIDRATLQINSRGVNTKKDGSPDCKVEHQNWDGYEDLICKFEDTGTGDWEESDASEVTVTGNLQDGTAIEGTDSICIKTKGGSKSKARGLRNAK